MKKLYLVLFTLLTMSAVSYSQLQPAKTTSTTNNSSTENNNSNTNSSSSVDISPTSMLPIMDDALPVIEYIEDSLAAEIVRIEYDLIFEGASKTTYRTLHDGYTYGVFVIGDYRVSQINMRLYKKIDGDWKLVDSTESDTETALLMIEPEEKSEYLFEIYADRFVENYNGGHYTILMFH